ARPAWNALPRRRPAFDPDLQVHILVTDEWLGELLNLAKELRDIDPGPAHRALAAFEAGVLEEVARHLQQQAFLPPQPFEAAAAGFIHMGGEQIHTAKDDVVGDGEFV